MSTIEVIKEKIVEANKRVDVFFKTETFNLLLKEAEEMHLTENGVLQMTVDGSSVGIIMIPALIYDAGVSYVKVKYIDDIYNATMPQPKDCIVL